MKPLKPVESVEVHVELILSNGLKIKKQMPIREAARLDVPEGTVTVTVSATLLNRLLSNEEKARESLQFYADPENWKSSFASFALQYDPPMKSDAGKRARVTLGIEEAESG